MKPPSLSWQIVTVIGMLLTTVVILFWLGAELAGIGSIALLILGALGFSVAQGAATKDLANGNLAAQRKAFEDLQKQYADDMARKDNQMALERAAFQQQLAAVHAKTVTLATMVPPEASGVVADGLASSK